MTVSKTSVIQNWLHEYCSWKEQTVVLCALRGTDSCGTPVVKSITRWIRNITLRNAAPDKTFMRVEPFPNIHTVAESRPLTFDMLPVHYLGHLMHALEVIGYRHPEINISSVAQLAYYRLCDYLHLCPETLEDFTTRLTDEVGGNDEND